MGYRFLEIGCTGKNNWWRYLLTLLIVSVVVEIIVRAISELLTPYIPPLSFT